MTGDEDGYDTATLTALYRAAQEGLTNARRHGEATEVRVAARFADDAARLVVEDNGRGFPAGTPGGGFGLRGMRERVELLGGSLNIDGASPAARR
ncbi:ATP-binding protein [Luedemannella flava]